MTVNARPTAPSRPRGGADRDAGPRGAPGAGDAPKGADAAITCGFCGQEFEEDRGQPTCRSCPLGEACRFVRCPHCGYENPARPGWLERLAALFGADEDTPEKKGGRHGGS